MRPELERLFISSCQSLVKDCPGGASIPGIPWLGPAGAEKAPVVRESPSGKELWCYVAPEQTGKEMVSKEDPLGYGAPTTLLTNLFLPVWNNFT